MPPESAPSRLLRGLPIAAAGSLSLILHGAIPWIDFGSAKLPAERVSLEIVSVPPPVLPVAEEEREGPADDAGEEAKPKPAKAPAKESQKPPVEEPSAKEPPSKEPEAVAAAPVKVEKKGRVRVRDQSARLDALRRELKARAQRRGGARAERKAGQGGGSTTEAAGSGKQGDPEAVYACTATERGKKVAVRMQRPLDEWVTVVPTVLVPFDTRPGLGDYLDGIAQIVSRRTSGVARRGPVEFAIPNTVLQMGLDEPRGVRVAIGRLDGRCLVGFRYSKNLFPLTLHHVPVRIIDHSGRTLSSLVDVTLFKDGSFDIKRRGGDELPFRSGRLKNAGAIREIIESHYAAARILKEVAGWFGIDLRKMAQKERKKRTKARAERVKRGNSVAQREK